MTITAWSLASLAAAAGDRILTAEHLIAGYTALPGYPRQLLATLSGPNVRGFRAPSVSTRSRTV